jgi:hypothetical protein
MLCGFSRRGAEHTEKKKPTKKEHNNKSSTAEAFRPSGGEDLGGVKNISHGLHRFTLMKTIRVNSINPWQKTFVYFVVNVFSQRLLREIFYLYAANSLILFVSS